MGQQPLCREIWLYLLGNVRLGYKKVDLVSGKDKKGMLDFQRPPPTSTGPPHLVGPEGMEAVLQVPSDLCTLGPQWKSACPS